MRLLRNYIVLIAALISAPYVFCWQGNTPEAALEEMVTTEKIEVLARHLPVKVEEAINSLDEKGKKEVAAKLLPKAIMKREGEVFAKSDDGTQWELRNEKKEVEGTIKLSSFISGNDALLSLEFKEHPPSQNSKHSDSDENPLPQRSREPGVMLVSMRLEGGEWRILGFGPWQQKNLEDEVLHGIIPNPQETNAAAAASALNELNAALAEYAATDPEAGFPSTLQQLSKPTFEKATKDMGLQLDPALMATPAIENGYEFRYTMIDPGTADPETQTDPEKTDPETQKGHKGRYCITATPVNFGITGSRSFFTDQSRVVRFTNENREANENDEPL